MVRVVAILVIAAGSRNPHDTLTIALDRRPSDEKNADESDFDRGAEP